MMRSLFSAVSGLRNHQTRMDVIGNNIANVNTVGFKRDRVNFQDIFYQMLQAPTAPGTVGGTNGQSIGVGMGIGSIDTFHTQGGVMYTGNPLDVMIQGDGYFILGGINDANNDSKIGRDEPITNKHYTRAGAFGISIGEVYTGSTTTQKHALLVDKATGMYVVGYVYTGGDTSREFNSTTGFPENLGNDDTKWRLGPIDLGDPTQIASYSIDDNGFVVVVDTSGTEHTVARLALAKFRNPEGLEKVGQNLFLPTPASGNPVPLVNTDGTNPLDETKDELAGVPGEGGLGTLVPGSLEMSNVELAQEFTDMITTQRGFQANARTITVSDEMLQELVNLKR